VLITNETIKFLGSSLEEGNWMEQFTPRGKLFGLNIK
jgi:hypothetical protein